MVRWDNKVHNSASSLFLLIIIRSCRLAEIWWSVCISKSQRSLTVSFSRIRSGLCIYNLFARSNFNFLHNSPWIALPTQSYLDLYSFYANLLHSLIMWLIVSSLSQHNLHLLFCHFDMVGPYGVVMWCYWKRFSFFLKVSFSYPHHVFSGEMLLVNRLKRS